MAVKIPAGNVRERPFADIWAHGAILQTMRGITVGALRSCATCEDRPWCSRCAGMARHEEGDLMAPNHEACRVAAAQRAIAEGRPVPTETPRKPGVRSLPVVT